MKIYAIAGTRKVLCGNISQAEREIRGKNGMIIITKEKGIK